MKITKLATLYIVLLLTFFAMFAVIPLTSAHQPPWEIPTYSYITVSPDPVGVGQTAFVLFWVNWVPPGSGGSGGYRWLDLTVDVTKPDGSEETLGPFTSDPVGGSYATYTPDQVGTYTFLFNFPEQTALEVGPTGEPAVNPTLMAYINDTFLSSSASTTLTVQEDQIKQIGEYPLPTEYWTRPIEGQNTAWASIASNWLGGQPGETYNVQPDGIAPNSPHILWTKILEDGGIVGGDYPGVSYYFGDSYEIRFNNPMIINGRLYYDLPLGSAKTGGGYICVDLYTGETLWYQNWTSSLPSFGQIYDYESINQHGVLPNGILWRTSGRGTETWEAHDSLTGKWLYTLTNVPSGSNVISQKGEILRYIIDTDNHWLALWNNTADQELTGAREPTDYSSTNYYQWRPVGKTVDASDSYSWNVTIPNIANVGGEPTVEAVIIEDMLLGSFGSGGEFGGFERDGVRQTNPGYTLFAISLEPTSRGTLLWVKDIPSPTGISRFVGPVDKKNRVFTMLNKETMQWSGYNLDDGELLWGPVGDQRDLQYYSSRGGGASQMQTIAYGNLYVAGFGGLVHCFNTLTGELEWTYGNGGLGNSTSSGLETVWGNYPTFIGMIADGKVYTFTEEHSVNTPVYKGAKMRCIDALTGEEIWTLMGYASSTSFYSRFGPVADGHLAFFNGYDGQVYCVGKGPSKTTVTASPKITSWGDSILLEGNVLDISQGTQQQEQAGDFPNGVPAIADEYMSEWMEYVYMQKPCPQYVEGVEVKLETLDPNGNFYEIDTVTSDAYGMFKVMWKPPVPGEYTIIATFEGSDSYWPSYAETSVGVTENSVGQQMEPEYTLQETVGTTRAPSISTEIAILIAIAVIAVIGIVSYWMLRRRQ